MPKWYVTANNRYLHDVPECLLVKNCPTPSGLPIPVANKIQNTIQYKDLSLDWWCFAHTMTSARASGRSNRLLMRPYATLEWRWFWHVNKIYRITALMLNGLYRNMSAFLEDNFLILEHKVSFGFVPYPSSVLIYNKANLRDLIAATGLVILLKLDSNHWFFSPCDLEIWWMTSKNYRAPLLHYIKLCASSQTPRWIQAGVTVRKHPIWVKIDDLF